MDMKTGFCTCFDRFLRVHRGDWRPATHYNWTTIFLNIYGPYFRERALSKIGPDDIIRLLDQRDLRPSSRAAYVKILRRFWSWAMEEGLAQGNPAKRVKLRPIRRRKVLPLTAAEAERCLDAVEGKYRDVLATMLFTGLRRHNVVTLRPEHVSDGLIQIPGELMKNGHDLIVPYHEQLHGILQRLPFGITRHAVAHLFRQLRERTGIGRVHPHLCRHTFGSWVARHAPESVVAGLLGHHRESNSITALYIHVELEQMREALAQLPVLV